MTNPPFVYLYTIKEVQEMNSERNMDLALLRTLCNAHGVSGYEDGVADIIIDLIKDCCDTVMKDSVGNVLAFKKGKKTPAEPIMLCAHMDEVGFSVKNINDDGTLDFLQVGMTGTILPSKRVLVGKNRIPGVISARPVHLSPDKTRAVKQSDLVIDIGARDKEQAESLGLFGDYAAFDSDFVLLGDGLVKAKALDDRIGCAVMCMLSKTELENDVYFAFTVGEELGGTGAVAATNRIKPGTALVLEGTTASDLYGYAEKDKVCKPRFGAVCPFMDGGTFYDNGLYKKILGIAKENNIKVQTKTKIAGGTDGAKIQRTGKGTRVVALSLACRYIHTSSSVGAVEDMESILRLSELFINSIA